MWLSLLNTFLTRGKVKPYSMYPFLSHYQILSLKDIQEKAFNSSYTTHEGWYETFHDGKHFKENSLLFIEEITLFLLLYIDDFEVFNPLGTS